MKILHLKILIAITSSFLSLPALSQLPFITPVIASDPKDFGGRINCLFQDKTGFIWIGKETGLYRYDGYQLKAFRHSNDSGTIGNDNIQCITEDIKGNLWIGTKGGGLNFYNKTTGTFKRFLHDDNNPQSIAYNEVFTILPEPSGNLWIGTDGGGLDYYNSQDGSFTHYTQDNSGLKSNKVLAIHKDETGNLWLGTWAGGLHFMDLTTKSIRQIKDGTRYKFNDINIFRIVEKDKGSLILATWGSGLIAFRTGNNTYEEVISPEKVSSIRDLKKNKNRIYAASSVGLLELDPASSRFAMAEDNSDLFSNTSSVLVDRSGIIWLGSENGSVGKINVMRKSFNTLTLQNGGAVNSLLSAENQSQLAITLSNALTILDTESGKSRSYQVPYPDLVSIGATSDGFLLASSEGLSALNMLSNKIQKVELNDSIINNRQIWSVYKENDTAFLIGALGVAYRVSRTDKNWRVTQVYETGKNGGISRSHYPACFLTDRNQNLWIGTFGGGLNLLKKDTREFINFSSSENSKLNLSDNFVECLFEDRRGNIWIGTHNGLDCYNPVTSELKSYNQTQGLQNSWIAAVAQDQHGNIWVSTHGGISCIQNDSTIRNYDTNDGLISNYFLPRSSARLQNGSLWFGSNSGIVWFYPDSIRINSQPCGVVITEFRINNKPVNAGTSELLGQNIEFARSVSLKQNDAFGFQFSALQYFNPKKSRYRYMLKGFDKEWQMAGEERTAQYSNVPPGKYTLLVVASNEDGVWSSNETTVEVIVLRLFPSWAIPAIVAVIIVLALVFYLKKKRKKQNAIEPENQPMRYREVNPSEIATGSAEDAFLQKALKVVEENISDPDFGVDEMCLKICISRPQLYRKIHAITGLSVTEFIKEVRLKRAAQLLKQKPQNISEIAYGVGFNDPKYFSKCFKQKFGMSPARFMDGNERLLPPQ